MSQPQKSNGKTNRIAGRATAAGTKQFAERFESSYSPDFYRHTAPDLTYSSLGMGTYLGDCNDREDDRYVEVLSAGISKGINILDTAINYRCQRSERAVGRALRETIHSGLASREEIVVCTKGGYVPLDGAPPATRAEYDAYLEKEFFSTSVISRSDLVAGGHCVKPKFLADQIARSRKNLGIDTIDVFYLHNPEQQLDGLDQTRFTTVMSDAFTELEAQVSAGNIGTYGCATWNGFRVFAANKSHLNLADLVQVAENVAGKSHHFRSVQLPVNLAMTEAVRSPTQGYKGKNRSLLELAGDIGMSVVASASLMQSQLTSNLPPEVKTLFPSLNTDAQRAIAFVRSLPVDSALVGTRSVLHLEENIAACSAAIQA
jgi:aryl-alcohol dehydrogenase-like predicted oxidoreductase